MDIKWKNRKNECLKWAIGIVIILGLLAVSLVGISAGMQKAKDIIELRQLNDSESVSISEYKTRDLYLANYILYGETVGKLKQVSAEEVFLRGGTEEIRVAFQSMYESLLNDYANTAYWVDTYTQYKGQLYMEAKNSLLADDWNNIKQKDLEKIYDTYWQVSFDAKGLMTIDFIESKSGDATLLAKSLYQAERENLLIKGMEAYYSETELRREDINYPTDITITYGIDDSEKVYHLFNRTSSRYEIYQQYARVYAYPTFLLSAFVIGIVALLIGNWKIGKLPSQKRILRYPGEIAALLALSVPAYAELFAQATYYIQSETGWIVTAEFIDVFLPEMSAKMILQFICNAGFLFLMYFIYFAALYELAPVFSLGLAQYIKEKTVVGRFGNRLKEKWLEFWEGTQLICWEDKRIKWMWKFIVLQFLVLSILSFFWFFAIPFLVVYAILAFCYLHRYYQRIQKNYQSLQGVLREIANGNLAYEAKENLGIFDDLQSELQQIQSGLKQAVEEAVKSQRMKTELITNVSHDLKTPLTAITTYIELLKDPTITEEQKQEYIETLESKTKRLKILIEDLFEVSKANSENLNLEYAQVDINSLLKQVSVEFEAAIQSACLEIRWKLDEQSGTLLLDSQKTYRIFANLFQNIVRYAMSGSRVYIESQDLEMHLQVQIRNMSAQELGVMPEELTERFIRGDKARNTEGSGLGLAIAKSLTEAQGGSFQVDIDGDLFKVTITFKK